MAVWHFADQPLSFQGTPAQPGHVRADTGFINEYQMFRVERCLILAPNVARRFDVRTILFGGVLSFF